MSLSLLETRDFDRHLSLSEKAARDETRRASEAFAAAMNRAIKRGKVKVTPGTFVDDTPTFARRIHGEAPMSACGSPAAMCMEASGAPGGAEAMK